MTYTLYKCGTWEMVEGGDLSLESDFVGSGCPGVPEPYPLVKMAADDRAAKATPCHHVIAAGTSKHGAVALRERERERERERV